MQRILLHFLDELRAAGLRIAISESIDALQSAASVGLERELLREALAASVIKDEQDRPLFEDIFARFFAGLVRARKAAELPASAKAEALRHVAIPYEKALSRSHKISGLFASLQRLA